MTDVSSSALAEATRIYNKVSNMPPLQTLACFLKGGVLHTCKTSTQQFIIAQASKNAKFIGCYNNEATLEWILEDFEYVGV